MSRMLWSRATLGVLLIVALFVGSEVAYVGAAELLLRTGLLEAMINSKPGKLRVRATRAHSYWPGRLSAERLEIRFQDRNLQANFDFERPRFTVELSELASRRFHVLWLETDGFELRLRTKREDRPEARRTARHLPPISGYDEFPLRRDEPPSPRPFTVELENVRGRVKELWIEQIRFQGDARVTGGFRLEPRRRLRIDASELKPMVGALAVGQEPFGTLRSGRLATQLGDVRLERGAREIVRALRASANVDLALDSPAPLAELVSPGWDVTGRGVAHLDGAVNRGRIADGSAFSVALPELAVEHDELGVRLALLAGARATPEERVELAMFGSELVSTHAGGRLGSVDDIELRLSRADRELADLTGFDLERANLRGLSVPDLGRLSVLTPRAAPLERGALRSDITLRTRDGERAPPLMVHAEGSLDGVRTELGPEITAAASGRFAVDLEGSKLGEPFWASGTLELDKFSLIGRGERASGSLSVPRARLRGHRELELLDAPFSATFDDGEQLLRVIGVTARPLPRAAASLADIDRVRLRGEVRHDPSSTALLVRDARSGKIAVAGCWVRERTQNGAFSIRSPVVNVGVTVEDGRTRVRPLAGSRWLDRALATLPPCKDLQRANARRSRDH